jgi:5'(3')-deoxyribonucleotidase
MKLYIDFDGTIANSSKRLIDVLNEKTGLNIGYMEEMSYYVEDKYPGITKEEVLDVFKDPAFFDELEIFEGFDLKDFTIVTIGTKENLLLKEPWCKKNLNKHVFVGLEKTSSGKSEFDMSDGIFIDDLTENLRSSNAKYKILFAPWPTTWNKTTKGDKDILIATTWREVKMLIGTINLIEKLKE